MRAAEAYGGEYIVCGDLNAKAAEWGAPVTNARGKLLLGWIAARNLTVLNNGKVPTCITANGESFIDPTLATPGLTPKIKGWRVSLEANLSDYRFIYYEIVTQGRLWNQKRGITGKKNIDREKFKTQIGRVMSLRGGQLTHLELPGKLKRSCGNVCLQGQTENNVFHIGGILR